MAKSIKMYNDCDIYGGGTNIEWYGYDKNTTFGEMMDKAINNKCRIIIKNGNGKWYLKGVDKDYATLKEKIKENIGKYPRRKCWLIKF